MTAADLKADGAMSVLLKDAMAPNLVQTLEGSPAFVHGGPFANIAHGCNSVMATRLGLKLADVVVTEAGFGADLGGEKFLDIKCRSAGLTAVLRRGGGDGARAEDAWRRRAQRAGAGKCRGGEARRRQPAAPCRESAKIRPAGGGGGQPFHLRHRGRVRRDPRRDGGARVRGDLLHPLGATAARAPRTLARAVVSRIEAGEAAYRPLYPLEMKLADKIRTIATGDLPGLGYRRAGCGGKRLAAFEEAGFGDVPVCIAKTQYSFTADPTVMGAPTGHVLPVREVRLSAGAGFVVAICGDIMTMPGLPRVPAAESIHLRDDGEIEGLF